VRLRAGDIGGTKTYLALFGRREDGSLVEIEGARYSSVSFPGLAPMVKLFWGQHDPSVDAAAFGVAGPVFDGQCRATNLPWHPLPTHPPVAPGFCWLSARRGAGQGFRAGGAEPRRRKACLSMARRRMRDSSVLGGTPSASAAPPSP